MEAVSEVEGPEDNNSTAKAIRGSSLLLVGRLISIASNVVVRVVLAQHFLKAELGVLLFALSISDMVRAVVALGQDRAMSHHLVIYGEDREKDYVLGTVLFYSATVISVWLIAASGIFLFRDQIAGSLGEPGADFVIMLALLITPLDSFDRMMTSFFAVFARPISLFVRNHILNPAFKLATIGLVVYFDLSPVWVIVGLIAAGVAGLLLYLVQIPGLVKQGRVRFVRSNLRETPIREILSFSMPLLSSEVVLLTIASVSTGMIGWMLASEAVATYQVIWPAARLNFVVMFAFGSLVNPMISRLYRREAGTELNQFYWDVSGWMMVLSLPVLLMTTAYGEQTTVFLFGDQYRDSAAILALLSVASFFDVAFGFNQQALQIHRRVNWVLLVNLSTGLFIVAANLVLIPAMGPLGAAVAALVGMVLRNIANHWRLRQATAVRNPNPVVRRVYARIGALIAVAVAVQLTFDPGILVAFAVSAVLALIGLATNTSDLRLVETFPQAARLRRFAVLERWL